MSEPGYTDPTVSEPALTVFDQGGGVAVPRLGALSDTTSLDDAARQLTIKRLRRRQELRTHAVTYALVNLMLIGIWAANGGGHFWPLYPLLGWGIGLGLHANQALGPQITPERIEAEVKKLKG